MFCFLCDYPRLLCGFSPVFSDGPLVGQTTVKVWLSKRETFGGVWGTRCK